MDNVFLELEGRTNDLLMVKKTNDGYSMKCTRLVRLDEKMVESDEEIVDVAVTSTSAKGEHPLFDGLIGKKIRITVETLD